MVWWVWWCGVVGVAGGAKAKGERVAKAEKERKGSFREREPADQEKRVGWMMSGWMDGGSMGWVDVWNLDGIREGRGERARGAWN